MVVILLSYKTTTTMTMRTLEKMAGTRFTTRKTQSTTSLHSQQMSMIPLIQSYSLNRVHPMVVVVVIVVALSKIDLKLPRTAVVQHARARSAALTKNDWECIRNGLAHHRASSAHRYHSPIGKWLATTAVTLLFSFAL